MTNELFNYTKDAPKKNSKCESCSKKLSNCFIPDPKDGCNQYSPVEREILYYEEAEYT